MLFKKHRKIFCIGANKTGTTSLSAALESLGLKVGNQHRAELLIHDWARRDYRKIIRYCRSAEAFQDIPFSYPDTFRAMDEAFPGSKFVLTVRSSASEWYDSLLRYHTKIIKKGRIPTGEDLREYPYCYKGFLWDAMALRYGADESMLYDRNVYVYYYENHNKIVKEYFRQRPTDLLVLNVADPDAMEKLIIYLGFKYADQKMPYLNSSK